MDLQGTRRRKTQKLINNELSDIYQHDLQMYMDPPRNEITLTEFEDLALERLQVLRIVELASQKGHKLYSDEWKQSILSDLKKEGLHKYYRLIQYCGSSAQSDADYQTRRADHISHFILRLAYCRSEELRRWFLSRELELFKLRFLYMNMKKEDVEKFLFLNKLTYTPISQQEKMTLREELRSSTAGVYEIDTCDFYKVPFVEVCGLVKNRRVFLSKGFAYIPSLELVTCILTLLRAHLSQALAYASRRLPSLDDDRLNRLLSNLHTTYTGRDYTEYESKSSIDPALLDSYSRNHFPLCMRHIHEVFRSTHTLKHGCRLQYGFFCKGIGLSFEDAMKFWREEFTKLIDGNEFEKRYAYQVKHNYGKVGNMVNYSPYSCIKIIMQNIGPGEHHGCPYKHWDVSYLKQKLTEYGLSNQGVQEICELAKNGHYQIACGKYFEYTHGQPPKNVITHPNQYFEESVALKEEKNQTPAKKVKTSLVKAEEIET